ncbi:MAG: hypothetical protein ACOX5G_10655 [Kiritimatiellia bacterium]
MKWYLPPASQSGHAEAADEIAAGPDLAGAVPERPAVRPDQEERDFAVLLDVVGHELDIDPVRALEGLEVDARTRGPVPVKPALTGSPGSSPMPWPA